MSPKKSKKLLEEELANICNNYQSLNFKWHLNITNLFQNATNPSIIDKTIGNTNIPIFRILSLSEQQEIPLIRNTQMIIEGSFLFDLLIMAQFNLWDGFNNLFMKKLNEIDSNIPDYRKFKEIKLEDRIIDCKKYRIIIRKKQPKKKRYSDIETIQDNLEQLFNITQIGDWNKFIGYYFSRNCLVHNSGYPDEKYEKRLKRVGITRPFIQEFPDGDNENKMKLFPFIHDVDFIHNFLEKYIFIMYRVFTSKFQIQQNTKVRDFSTMEFEYGY